MSYKRKLTAADSPSAKRSRLSDERGGSTSKMAPATTSHERPRNHPVYGQKSAFPGLDAGLEDELFYGPAEDGIEYLRMVRSEANSLPLLFTAPKPSLPADPTTQEAGDKEQGEEYWKGDRGIYIDGAYIAPPLTDIDSAPGLQTSELADYKFYPEAQASYYNLLRHRFLLLRSTLRCTPPVASISALDESHPISFPRHSVAAKKEWRRLLLAVDPHMAQLACMDLDSVLGVLGIMARLMSENFRSGDQEQVRRIGAWAWGLLGKCREVGQLGTEEVGEIRDLGKRAVRILQRMKEDEESRGGMMDGESSSSEVEQAGPDRVDTEGIATDEPGADTTSAELEAAKARLQAKLQADDQGPSVEEDAADPQPTTDIEGEENGESEAKASSLARQTHAMLDMIITVVGEFYGQRDLLGAREIWNSN